MGATTCQALWVQEDMLAGDLHLLRCCSDCVHLIRHSNIWKLAGKS